MLPDLKDKTTSGYLSGTFGDFNIPGDFQGRNRLLAAHQTAVRAWQQIAKTAARLLADESKLPLARHQAAATFARQQLELARRSYGMATPAAEAEGREIAAELQKHLAPAAGAGQAILEGEIRSRLRDMTPDERMTHLNAALAAGDLVTVRSAVSAPVFLSGLAEQTRERLVQNYLSRVEPSKTERLRLLVDAIDATNRAFRALEEHAREASGIDWASVESLEAATRDTAA